MKAEAALYIVSQYTALLRQGRRSLDVEVRLEATILAILHNAQSFSIARLRLRRQVRCRTWLAVRACSTVRRQRHRQCLCSRRNAWKHLLPFKQSSGWLLCRPQHVLTRSVSSQNRESTIHPCIVTFAQLSYMCRSFGRKHCRSPQAMDLGLVA